jgi:hypothetical protein
MEMVPLLMASNPYYGDNPQPADRYLPLALLCMDLVRSEADAQPEGIIAGAGGILCQITQNRSPVAKAVYEAGFLGVFDDVMQRYNPMERISGQNLILTGVFSAFRDVIKGAQQEGVNVIQPLLDVGALDIAISALNAYQMLGKPEQVGVCVFTFGVLDTLELLLGSEQARPIVTSKLRSAGVDSFRYMLDHPLAHVASMGMETGIQGTKIAALVRLILVTAWPPCSHLCRRLTRPWLDAGLGARRRRWRFELQAS